LDLAKVDLDKYRLGESIEEKVLTVNCVQIDAWTMGGDLLYTLE